VRTRLFNFAAAGSLVLLAVIVIARVQSRHMSPFVCWARGGGRLFMVSVAGTRVYALAAEPWPCDEWRAAITSSRWTAPEASSGSATPPTRHPGAVETESFTASVSIGADGRVPWTNPSSRPASPPGKTTAIHGSEISVPVWLAAVLTAITPATWGIRRGIAWARKARQKSAGHCQSCSYDLTGNTSGICPECGTPIPRKSEAAA
jgi:hypothetical protein